MYAEDRSDVVTASQVASQSVVVISPRGEHVAARWVTARAVARVFTARSVIARRRQQPRGGRHVSRSGGLLSVTLVLAFVLFLASSLPLTQWLRVLAQAHALSASNQLGCST